MRIGRFLYLNIYAFLLLALGALVFIMPEALFLFVLKILTALWCALAGIVLLSSWKKKMRKMKTLAARNAKEIRPDTFKKLSETLCGRLMVQLTLADLRKTEAYSALSKADWKALKRKTFGKQAKNPRRKRTDTIGV
jgi:hypothetical protein